MACVSMHVSSTGLESVAKGQLNMPVRVELGIVVGIRVHVLCAAASTPLSKHRERMKKKIHLPVVRKDGGISRR